jgi:hypothetical protein
VRAGAAGNQDVRPVGLTITCTLLALGDRDIAGRPSLRAQLDAQKITRQAHGGVVGGQLLSPAQQLAMSGVGRPDRGRGADLTSERINRDSTMSPLWTSMPIMTTMKVSPLR